MGHLEDGRLYLCSRKRDLILRGGENVYPQEIEQRLEAHPQVAECAVMGVPDEELGQRVAAFVRVTEGTPAPTPQLEAALRVGVRDPRLLQSPRGAPVRDRAPSAERHR
ncbi:MAG: hypothetical protein IPG17_26580 [Sandaracinaceae bacterium]|nr:hypothetical protein [Sandaracinaceae bacterium]